MNDEKLIRVMRWIESGRQIGLTYSYDLNGEKCWSSVAVQKWNGIFKIYIDEILESKMIAEQYLKEELFEVKELESISSIVESYTKVQLTDLKPLKGHKIFNPSFDKDQI